MPPKPIVWLILLFWAASTSWLFYRDVWPRIRPGDVPAFTIDLAYEAQRKSSTSTWRILRGGKGLGLIHTDVNYQPEDDTFELHMLMKEFVQSIGPLKIVASEVQGGYRVTRTGQLRSNYVDADVSVGLLPGQELKAKIHFEGKVEGDQYIPMGIITVGDHQEKLPLEPVAVSAQGSILNPLHPVNRISGLRRGQHWQVPLMNPIADSIEALMQKQPLMAVFKNRPRITMLHAEVLSETQRMHHDNEEVDCLVIEYRGDHDLTAHTWVRESDGKVLKQEVTLWGERLVLERL